MTKTHRLSGIRIRRAAMLLCLMLVFCAGGLYGAEKKERKVVRVSYLEFNRLMIVDGKNKPVSGYAYEYIQTIATYAGWDIEFVPCSSFADSVIMLREGKVDLFYDVSKTPEREKEMLFPNEPMGYEYYYLYSADHTSVTPGDRESLKGKIVGVTRGTILPELMKKWCREKNVPFKFTEHEKTGDKRDDRVLNIVEYESISDKEVDLYAGKIDLDLELSMLAKRNLSAVEKIGASAYYLAVNPKRSDLVDDLNAAVEKVLSNDLFYFSRLQERYFSDTVLSRNLTAEEKNWLAEHKVLRVGYLDNYLPFSSKDDKGRPIGAGIDTIREILKILNLKDRLKAEFICFADQRDGYRAVESGKIDLMLPAYVSDSVKQDHAVIGSKSMATLAINLAYLKGLGQDATKRIGVNRNNMMQYYYCRDFYPNSEIVLYDDIQSCLDGLLDRTSDGTFLNGLRSDALLKPGRYHAVRRMRAKDDFTLRMAFAKDNIGLMLLMNRGLTMLDADFVNKASYAYVRRMYSFSVTDFLMEHIRPVIAAVAIVAALTVALIGYWISNRKLAAMNRKLTEHAAIIEKQRRQESELRQQLENKQGELKDALLMAQSASRAKSAFLSNMSHDIRTPMNAIVGFTELAAGHVDEPDRVREYLANIEQSSEHLLSLINDVLDMSRIESGKMTLHEKEESLADMIRTIHEIVIADVKAKQLDFRIETADIRNEFVYCDKLRLDQVLLNLLSNAIKYTDRGGKIRLRIAQKQSEKAGCGAFEFRVKDNGIGMSEEFAKTIFEPFTREENSTVSGIQGTGLGMAITKSIVDMMAGSISVSTKKGEGSEFVVSADLGIAAGKAPDPALSKFEGARALVAGGDADAGRNIAAMLRVLGLRGEWCTSAEEAVARAEEAVRGGDRFEVFIADTGDAEALRRLREVAGKDAFILVTTADCGECTDAAAIPPPLFPSDLEKALLKCCGGPSAKPDAPGSTAFSLKGKKVLLVDDSEVNLKIGVLLLQGQGMIVSTARNGKIAVDTIREKGVDAYDLIVMDVQMPVMGGYEATGVLRKLPGGDKLKIIAFSANAFEEDREKSLKAGMDGHITKPLKINDLLNELKRFAA